MINRIPRNIWRFILLILLQVFIFNNIEYSNWIVPYIYVLFILLLPFETPKWAMLVSAFFLGLLIDIFSETLGMHAAACVFMAYMRPFALSVFSPREGYEAGSFPRIHYYGFYWFVKYSAVLIFAHHLFLFSVEIFRVSEILVIFFRTIVSSLFTLIFITISQYFVYRQ